MQTPLRSKHRLKELVEANTSQINSKLDIQEKHAIDFKNPWSCWQFGQGMKAKFVVRFAKNANQNLTRVATNAYQSTLRLFSVCRQTVMQYSKHKILLLTASTPNTCCSCLENNFMTKVKLTFL